MSCSETEKKDILTPEERIWLSKHDGKIVIDQSYDRWAPIEDLDQNGNPVGIAIDYYKLIEKKLNFRFKVDEARSWEERLKRFQSGEIDVVNNLQKTPQRSQYLLFTKPYIEIPYVIIVRKESKGSLTLKNMKNMTISVTKGFAIHEYLKNNYAYLNLVPVSIDQEALQEVSLKRVDAAIINLAVASYLIEKEGISNLRIAGDTGYNNALCLASRKDWPILNSILEKGLASITPVERITIYDKWIHLELKPFYKNPTFQIIMALSIVIMIISFFWNSRLRKEIKDRKQAEENLESQHQLMDTLLNNLQVGVFMVEAPSGRPLIANRRAIELLGRGIMDSANKTNLAEIYRAYKYGTDEIFPKDELPIILGLTGKSHSVDDLEVIHPCGDRILLEVAGSPVRDSKGQVIASLVSFSDITSRKRMEKALQDSEQNMASVLNNTQDCVVRIDKNLRYIFANPIMYKMTGLSVEKFLGKTNEELGMPEELCSFWKEKHEAVFSSGKPITFEFNFSTVTNGERIFQAIVTPEFNKDDNVETIISFIRDITDLRIAETEKNDMIVRLEKALADVKKLSGLVPICANCKNIRDDKGYWNNLESYIEQHSEAAFSHGICPDCERKLYGDEEWYLEMKKNKKKE